MAIDHSYKMVAVYVVQFIKSGFQVIQYSNARYQAIIDHLNNWLVLYLDPLCTKMRPYSLVRLCN
jgi:hypothetical protein